MAGWNGPVRVAPALLPAICWGGGFLIAAFAVHIHQLWLLWLGLGVIGGIGLGLGYISPVSTLIKWFPDRRGMATGMAIMGFGGGAMIGSPIAILLMNHFKYGPFRRRVGNDGGHGRHLSHLHALRRIRVSRAAGRLEARWMGAAYRSRART